MAEVKHEVFPSESPLQEDYSKGDVTTADEGGLSDPNHVNLHRALKARHITMIGTRSSRPATSIN